MKSVESIKVSIIVLVYNHESFLSRCLDNILNQKVDFNYEVLIHDDCSTDFSKKIIQDYYGNYPNIIVPFFQCSNQYSKGVNIIQQILLPSAKGDFIAICEGDDYWCDSNKLQKQYDFMKKNTDYIMCVHNTKCHYLSANRKDKNFNQWESKHILSNKDAFIDRLVHTSSYFLRKENCKLPKYAYRLWAADYAILTWMHAHGKVMCLPDVMSVYNSGVASGAMHQLSQLSVSRRIEKDMDIYRYLENLKIDVDVKYHSSISIKQEVILYKCLIIEYKNELINKNTKKLKILRSKLKKTNSRRTYFINVSIKEKIEFLLILYFRHIYYYIIKGFNL